MGINLHRMELDQYGNIYVSSRGDYYDTYSETFVIDSNTDKVIEELPLLPNTEMAICRDSLYVYSTEWSYYTNSWTVSYAIYNTKTKKTDTRNFITDGTEKSIKIPYGIAINPETGEVCIKDASGAVAFEVYEDKKMIGVSYQPVFKAVALQGTDTSKIHVKAVSPKGKRSICKML